MRTSLTATLMLWVVLLIGAIVPVRSYFDLRSQLQRTGAAYDAALIDWTQALGKLVRLEAGQVRLDLNAQTETSLRASGGDDSIYYVVLGPDGAPIAGDVPLALPTLALARGERRVLDARLGTQPVRMAVQALDCGAGLCQVRVAETLGQREAAWRATLWRTLVLASAAALLFAAAVWFAVRRALRPLASINAQLAERSLDDLRPLRRGRLPTELQPLVDAVDQLLARMAADAERQRHFIADAAHQLRTPLTALRTESELALLEPHEPAMRATLERMQRSSQRVARLADQLLALARSDASSHAGANEPLDLKAVAQDAARDWVPRALERGADLGFQLAGAPLRGRRHLLGELLGNLIHNALEYAAGEGARAARITVRCGLLGGAGAPRAFLEVEDNGPGIAPADRGRVLQRFVRLPGSPGAGSGLGLAIVHDIARAHDAAVELLDAEEGPGLRVRVVFQPNRVTVSDSSSSTTASTSSSATGLVR